MKLRYRILNVLVILLAAGIVTVAIALSHESECAPRSELPQGNKTMSAIMHRCYGAAELLTFERVEKPVPADDEILVKIRASSINPFEWHYMTGTPYLMRTSAGLGAPEDPRIGADFAGTVEAVGKNVRRFAPGDDVFGSSWGTFAEYVTVRESGDIARKPPNVSFEEAASVPMAAITALQALRDHGQLKPGESVLINGASGGVGTFAVQIAKALGAEVTGVCSTRNLELVRSIGADHVVDYTREDFAQGDARYDLIVDNVGNRDVLDLVRVLEPNGRLVLVGAPKGGRWIAPLWGAIKLQIVQPFVDEALTFMLANSNPEDLTLLGELVGTGKIKPVIDRRYALRDVPEAMRYLQTWHARGKVVIVIG